MAEATWVSHDHLGDGKVIGRRKSGFELQVEFNDNATIWVRMDHLTFHPPESPTPVPTLLERRVPPSNHRARVLIEALRLGIVPDQGVNLYTVGREEELIEIEGWLYASDNQSRKIVGSYGSGKTHLQRYISQVALNSNFAVALVDIEPLGSPFSKPKRLYSQIVENLRWSSGSGYFGFRELITKALQSGLLNDHKYFGSLQGQLGDEKLWNWIQARDPSARPYSFRRSSYSVLRGMYDYTTAANIYCYLLSTIAWLCQQEPFGMEGLLLVFDEAETVDWSISVGGRERGHNFIKGLLRVANRDPELLKLDPFSGLTYSGHAYDIPFSYSSEINLKLLFAVTQQSSRYPENPLNDVPGIVVNELNLKHIKELIGRVTTLYSEAYSTGCEDIQQSVEDRLAGYNMNTRMQLKSIVEALDIERLTNTGLNDN